MQQQPPWSFRSAASPGSVGYQAGSERWSGLLVNTAFRTGHNFPKISGRLVTLRLALKNPVGTCRIKKAADLRQRLFV